MIISLEFSVTYCAVLEEIDLKNRIEYVRVQQVRVQAMWLGLIGKRTRSNLSQWGIQFFQTLFSTSQHSPVFLIRASVNLPDRLVNLPDRSP